jgi:methyl-accepting chemotaxis protein
MKNQEYILTKNDLIVSKTDLKGIITFVNDDLVRITGYSRAELIGASHNIFRHPDMPKEAFSDLWKTIKHQFTWSGLVKNKTKSGGFYWVRANVTPIYENEKIIGYMSVRRKPDANNVREIEKIYADMRAGKFKGKLSAGNILKDDIFHRLLRNFHNISIRNRLIGLGGFSVLSLIFFVFISQLNTNALNNNSQFSIEQISKRADSIELARSAQVDFKEQLQEWKNTLLRGQDKTDFDKFKNAFYEKSASTDKKLEQLHKLVAELGESTQQVDELLQSHQQILKIYTEALQNYQTDNINSITQVDASVRGKDRNLTGDFDKLVEVLQSELKGYISESKHKSNQMLLSADVKVDTALVFILAMLVCLFGVMIVGIIRPLRHATESLLHISNGNYLVRIDNFTTNEIGIMTEAMRAMSVRLGFDIAEDRKNLNEGLRLKIGLDNVETGVIIANENREIVYINKSATHLLRKAEADIQNDLPNFSVDKLMGTNIDSFHKYPAHQIKILENLTETSTASALIGGHHMVVKASPIINSVGQRLGAVAEWSDITVQVNLENEISTIVEDAVQGRFNNRLNLDDKEGFFKQLSTEINELLTISDSVFGDLKRVLDAVAKGNLTEKITQDYNGEFNAIKVNMNLAVSQLVEVIHQIQDSNEIIYRGIEELSQGNNDLSSRTEIQSSNLESTVAAVHQLAITVNQNAEDAEFANETVSKVFDVVDKGVSLIGKVVETMEGIHDSSLKVVDIIAVIDSIAFQTNILALNAAVEAARAGEQGKGFAVVASEVRSLAQRAATAAGEIKSLINDSEEKVEDGSRLVTDAGKTMKDISLSIEEVKTMMGRISVACSEQSYSVQKVKSTITETEEMSQQNAALVVEAAGASSSLENQVKHLSDTVAYFKVS